VSESCNHYISTLTKLMLDMLRTTRLLSEQLLSKVQKRNLLNAMRNTANFFLEAKNDLEKGDSIRVENKSFMLMK
jgi:hypothetical protein